MDKFDCCHSQLKISNGGQTLKVVKKGDPSAVSLYRCGFVGAPLSPAKGGSCSCRFKIDQLSGGVHLGLARRKDIHHDENQLIYAINSSGYRYTYGKHDIKKCFDSFAAGATVEILADFAAKTLSFSVNGEIAFVFDNFDIKYDCYFAAAVFSLHVGDGLTLIGTSMKAELTSLRAEQRGLREEQKENDEQTAQVLSYET